ncbi:mucin-5AC-like isoform X1 [Pelobates cultripes]|uniref:Mucin-5AC-like isoform X1 n=1 Tax=Pelobates cultripes TaxID=61616 RepID=A0AAD1TJ15_PELCU|nr:mucin-5AC-like isoform X1 [Pelobates cultripes]
MANHWKVNVTGKPYCNVPPPKSTPPPGTLTTPPPVCKPSSLCDVILSDVFAECHKIIPPKPYHEGCVFDACRIINDSVACSSLEIYASLCTAHGVCVDWRPKTAGHCPFNCLSGKIYNACGPMHAPTCENREVPNDRNGLTEGCYCPSGTKLFNSYTDVCVASCSCVGPDGMPKKPTETWTSNCKQCVCEATSLTVQCKTVQCAESATITCDKEGYVVVQLPDPNQPCCMINECRCNSTYCLNKVKSCPLGFEAVPILLERDCCPTYDCKPMEVCVFHEAIYQPGKSIPQNKKSCEECICTEEKDAKTKLNMIACYTVICNKVCDAGYLYEDIEGQCCGECVQVACIMTVDVDNTVVIEPGQMWYSPLNNCSYYECNKTNEHFVTMSITKECSVISEDDCTLGHKFKKADNQCCGTCEQVACTMKLSDDSTKILKVLKACTVRSKACSSVQERDLQPYEKWTPPNEVCISYECDIVEGQFVPVTVKRTCLIVDCDAGYEYKIKSGQCCGECIKVACSIKMGDNSAKILQLAENHGSWNQTKDEQQRAMAAEHKPVDTPDAHKLSMSVVSRSIKLNIQLAIRKCRTNHELGQSYTPEDDKCTIYKCSDAYTLETKKEICPAFDSSLCVENKDGTDPRNYKTIVSLVLKGLINVDMKIYSDIIAERIKNIISKLIHPDQIGCIPDTKKAFNRVGQNDILIYPILNQIDKLSQRYKLIWTDKEIDYLGLTIPANVLIIMERNALILMKNMNLNLKKWQNLETSWIGRINIINSYILTKCGYIFFSMVPLKMPKPCYLRVALVFQTILLYVNIVNKMCYSNLLPIGKEKCINTWEKELNLVMPLNDWLVSLTYTNKYIHCLKLTECHFKVIHRWYFTPTRLAKMYDTYDSTCWRCGTHPGTYIHICKIIIARHWKSSNPFHKSHLIDQIIFQLTMEKAIINNKTVFSKKREWYSNWLQNIPTFNVVTIYMSITYVQKSIYDIYGGTIKMSEDGCCKTCDILVAVECQVRKQPTRINTKTCESDQTVELTYCEGRCMTTSIYSADANAMQHACSCCQERKTSIRKINLPCLDGTSFLYTYIYVEQCGCTTTECEK